MTSAVKQVANKHLAGCFIPAHDSSNLRGCLSSPFWCKEKPESEGRISMLLSKNADQAAFAPLNGAGNESVSSESDSGQEEKVALPLWRMNSDPVQGKYFEGCARVEETPDEGPFTPMQSYSRQRHRPDETMDSMHSLPSLSLSLGSPENQNEKNLDSVHVLQNHHKPSFMTEEPSLQQIHQQQFQERSYKLATSAPCKNYNRIHLEVQREGPEFHKENLLSLLLAKHGKAEMGKKAESFISPSHCVGHRRVLARTGGPEMLLRREVHSAGNKCQQSTLGTHPVPSLRGSSVSLSSAPFGKAGKRRFESFGSMDLSPSSAVVFNRSQQQPEIGKSEIHVSESCFPSVPMSKCLLGDLNVQMKASTSCMNAHQLCNSNYTFAESGTSDAVYQPFSTAHSSVDSVRHLLSLSNPLVQGTDKQEFSKEEESGKFGSNNSGKRQKSGFSQKQQQSKEWCDYKPCTSLLEDAEMHQMKVEKETKLKRQAMAEHCNTLLGRSEVADTSGLCHFEAVKGKSSQLTYMRKQVTFTDCENEVMLHSNVIGNMLEMRTDGINFTQKATVGLQLDPVHTQESEKSLISSSILEAKYETCHSELVRYLERQSSESLRESTNRQAVGLKLFTVSAHAEMPRPSSTFATGGPSLAALPSGLCQRMPDSVEVGVQFQQEDAAHEADWGKFLALSATSVTSGLDSDDGGIPRYQQRFKKLQAFLKQCDESDQRDHLQALRSLSASARSGHAVKLETRAINLSLEEGKEMNRMTMLDVLRSSGDTIPVDAGYIIHGSVICDSCAPTKLI